MVHAPSVQRRHCVHSKVPSNWGPRMRHPRGAGDELHVARRRGSKNNCPKGPTLLWRVVVDSFLMMVFFLQNT